MPIKFLANHNTIIYGPSGCGKTHFILKVLEKKLIDPFPENIYYMYKVEQDFMKKYPNITFLKGLSFDKVDTSKPSCVICDDLLLDANKEVASAFILGSHHKKISLFFITQNLFPNSETFRIMSNNAHFVVAFRNPRNQRQIFTLARQVFVGKDVDRILAAYKRIQDQPRGFILLSFSPRLPKELTVITDYWSPWLSVYL
jgi:hypothetical protein